MLTLQISLLFQTSYNLDTITNIKSFLRLVQWQRKDKLTIRNMISLDYSTYFAIHRFFMLHKFMIRAMAMSFAYMSFNIIFENQCFIVNIIYWLRIYVKFHICCIDNEKIMLHYYQYIKKTFSIQSKFYFYRIF